MQPPVPYRYRAEDFQDAPEWISRVFTPLNRFQEQAISVMDAGVTLIENIPARKYKTDFLTASNYNTGVFDTITFSWPYQEQPSAVFITKAQHVDNTPFLGSVGVPQWTFNGGYIVIYYIPGLANSKDYTFHFLAI